MKVEPTLLTHFSEEFIRDFFLDIAVENTPNVRAALEAGLSCSVIGADGVSAVQAAIRDGCVDIALLLIEQGANCHDSGLNGGSLLHDASWSGTLVDALLSKGVDPTLLDNDLRCPLYRAAENGCSRAVRSLAAAGCNVDLDGITDNIPGVRAIHIAARAHDIEVLKALAESGADVTAPDGADQSVIHHASGSSYRGLFSMDGDFQEFIKVAQNFGVDINSRNDLGYTALKLAQLIGDENKCEALTVNGAVLDAQSNATSILKTEASHRLRNRLSMR